MALATEVILVNQAGEVHNPPAPLVASYTTAWKDTVTPKTVSVTSAVGDLLVALTMAEDDTANVAVTGHSLTWASQIDVGNSAQGRIRMNTAVETAAGTWTATATNTGSVTPFGLDVIRFSGVTIGAKASLGASPSADMQMSITTTVANSAILFAGVDWSAIDGYSRLWTAVNGYSPKILNTEMLELLYVFYSGDYTVYAGWYPDAGAIGAKTVGMTFPGGSGPGGHSMAAIELVPAGGGGGAVARPRPRPRLVGDLYRPAAHRAANW